MGIETTIVVNKAWATSIGKYPQRFGKLVANFHNLLDEAKLKPERKDYWLAKIKELDTFT